MTQVYSTTTKRVYIKSVLYYTWFLYTWVSFAPCIC